MRKSVDKVLGQVILTQCIFRRVKFHTKRLAGIAKLTTSPC